ncbi:MAG: hypothetical protein AB1729_05120 [Pseudomonadota bacterium]|uniref:hypothetical protein n=1 Tax=Blastomonas sp. TaxID=1909299 RepID=UPI0017CFEAB5|nr:hypothetical protein [Blastomonas sp.]
MNGSDPWHDALATALAAPSELRDGVNTIVDQAVAEGMTLPQFKVEVQALFSRLATTMHSAGNAPATAPTGEGAQ